MFEAKPIPLIRAGYVTLIAKEVARRGVDGSSKLLELGLPEHFEKQPDGYLALNAVHSFVRWAEVRAGNSLLADAWSALTISDFSRPFGAAVRGARSLGDVLRQVARFAAEECSPSGYQIHFKESTNEVRIEFSRHCSRERSSCTELLQLFSILTVMRRFFGARWQPDQIFLRASEPDTGVCFNMKFKAARVLFGQPTSGICFRVSAADMPHIAKAAGAKSGTLQVRSDTFDFPASLKALLRPYLDSGNLEINMAASVAGISIRTLQRRLQTYAVSYSGLVQEVRLELAAELLKSPDVKVIDAAYAVGYSDPSHFSRAFRRLSGMTPRQYRSLSLNGDLDPNWRGMAGTPGCPPRQIKQNLFCKNDYPQIAC